MIHCGNVKKQSVCVFIKTPLMKYGHSGDDLIIIIIAQHSVVRLGDRYECIYDYF
jgi:hypothetical protein